MDFFFEPKGIAVVGASPNEGGGRNLLTNLALGYPGPVYPVNPKYDRILGLKCYARVSDIEGPLDLAIVHVAAKAVPPVLEDCVRKGIRGAILESGGFAEVGMEGRVLQNRCLEIARKGGMRLWGPNCMGLVDPWKRYFFSFMNTNLLKESLNPGSVSLIVQSGLLSAGFIATLMGNRILGLAKACSIGNRSDVEETELLEYLLKDPETKVIALYLESFARGRRFFELAASSRKPIVLLKGGKSPLGAEASVSHTASLAGNYDLIKGILDQAGIHQADDFFEMADIARSLDADFQLNCSSGEKPRMAILAYSGAAGIVTADHMEKWGLTVARFSPQTQKRLEELSPPWMPVKNPIDFWPALEKHDPALVYKHAIEILHSDPEVDGVIVHLFAGRDILSLNMREIMSGIKPPRKPILFWLIGPEKEREPLRLALEKEGYPAFHEIQRMVKVMAGLFRQSRKRNRSPELSSPDLLIPDSLKETLHEAAKRGGGILDEHVAKKWFGAVGLNVVRELIARDLEGVIRAAEEIGYPVVLKGRAEGQIHKTEAGLVKLNLLTADQVEAAYREMLGLKTRPESFLIQPMLKGDLELIAGIIRDPQFGPSAMLGIGGVRAEIYRDVVFRLLPICQEEIFEMVSELKGGVLLRGFRGSKPVNLKSLTDWLVKLGGLAMTFDLIQSIDVNPLLIVDGEPIAVDATMIIG